MFLFEYLLALQELKAARQQLADATTLDEWEAARFLRLLACVCRHALPLARFNEDRLWQSPPGCTPTFLISDPEPSKIVVASLNASQHGGFTLARGGGRTISQPFTAVILDGDDGTGGAPNSFLRINATPQTRPRLLDEDELRKIEEKFQPQLLLYRLHHRSRVVRSSIDAGGLDGSTRALACVLASCFPDDQSLQQRVVELLKPQDEAWRLDTAVAESAVVLDALLVLCHQGQSSFYVGRVAENANEILDMHGDGFRLDPRRVGSILKGFGLLATRDSKGYRLSLTTAVKLRIHELGRSYDVPFFKGEIQPCEFCKATSSGGV